MNWLDPHTLIDMSLGCAVAAVGWTLHRLSRPRKAKSPGVTPDDGPYRTAARRFGSDADGEPTADQAVDAALRRAGEQLAAGKMKSWEYIEEVGRLTRARQALRDHAADRAAKVKGT